MTKEEKERSRIQAAKRLGSFAIEIQVNEPTREAVIKFAKMVEVFCSSIEHGEFD